jgi:hypothetical protein
MQLAVAVVALDLTAQVTERQEPLRPEPHHKRVEMVELEDLRT